MTICPWTGYESFTCTKCGAEGWIFLTRKGRDLGLCRDCDSKRLDDERKCHNPNHGRKVKHAK